jgi:hypothetical protein
LKWLYAKLHIAILDRPRITLLPREAQPTSITIFGIMKGREEHCSARVIRKPLREIKHRLSLKIIKALCNRRWTKGDTTTTGTKPIEAND